METDDLFNKESKQNLKKPVIYGAAAFLVFIIGVIGYAIYANSTNKDNVVLPPQVNEKPVKSEFKKIKVEDNLSAENQKINKNEILINTDEPVENENNQKLNTKKEVNLPVDVKTVKKAAEKEEQKEVVYKEQKAKQPLKVVKEKPKTVGKERAVIKGKYYIQVAALLKYKKPNKKFLALIKKEGFNYKVYNTFIVKNGHKIPITKILIGPFENRKIARKNLVFIKKRLTQNAFLFRMK